MVARIRHMAKVVITRPVVMMAVAAIAMEFGAPRKVAAIVVMARVKVLKSVVRREATSQGVSLTRTCLMLLEWEGSQSHRTVRKLTCKTQTGTCPLWYGDGL